eukprot:15065652-Alexandrium_andersonii.AAC.1
MKVSVCLSVCRKREGHLTRPRWVGASTCAWCALTRRRAGARSCLAPLTCSAWRGPRPPRPGRAPSTATAPSLSAARQAVYATPPRQATSP